MSLKTESYCSAVSTAKSYRLESQNHYSFSLTYPHDLEGAGFHKVKVFHPDKKKVIINHRRQPKCEIGIGLRTFRTFSVTPSGFTF